ncbi:MAG: hypothetical protein ACREMD_00260 [Gemmatimonadota bacterium]
MPSTSATSFTMTARLAPFSMIVPVTRTRCSAYWTTVGFWSCPGMSSSTSWYIVPSSTRMLSGIPS